MQNRYSEEGIDCFYVDKIAFIKEWWEREDSVTLLTRPRRFGKTLNLSKSGFGRYDVVLEPKDTKVDDAIILELKVRDPQEEADLVDTVKEAHKQIVEKKYDEALMEKIFHKNISDVMVLLFRGKKF